MLKKTGVLSIRQRYAYKSFIFIYKAKNNLLPTYLNELFQFNNEIHNYNTRNNNYFYVPKRACKYTSNCLAYNDLIEFNNLPNYIRLCSNLSDFKSLLFNYVRNNL